MSHNLAFPNTPLLSLLHCSLVAANDGVAVPHINPRAAVRASNLFTRQRFFVAVSHFLLTVIGPVALVASSGVAWRVKKVCKHSGHALLPDVLFS